jgi:hypothetical protein
MCACCSDQKANATGVLSEPYLKLLNDRDYHGNRNTGNMLSHIRFKKTRSHEANALTTDNQKHQDYHYYNCYGRGNSDSLRRLLQAKPAQCSAEQRRKDRHHRKQARN